MANDELVCSLANVQCPHRCKGESSFVFYAFNEAETANSLVCCLFSAPLCQTDTAFDLAPAVSCGRKGINPSADLMSVKA